VAVATELYDDSTADDSIDITQVPPSLPAPGGSATVPTFDYIATYKGRLWGMVASTNKIHWSPPNAPWLFPATSARSLPMTRDEGTGFAVSGESLYVSQRRHLFMLDNIIADTDTGEIIPSFREVDDSTGFASQRAVCVAENTLWFLSGEGKVYQTAGASVAQERAPQIEATLKRLFTKRLDQAEVEKAVAAELVKFDGVAAAVSSTALRTDGLPDTLLMRAILRNFHPKRSGDIYVVFEPNVFINDFDGLTVASSHGSPWRYDSFVPVIFAGAQLKPATVGRPITPYDVAPTLADYLGVKPPSGSIGVPLAEIVRD